MPAHETANSSLDMVKKEKAMSLIGHRQENERNRDDSFQERTKYLTRVLTMQQDYIYVNDSNNNNNNDNNNHITHFYSL